MEEDADQNNTANEWIKRRLESKDLYEDEGGVIQI
jgi:hypothetical protein